MKTVQLTTDGIKKHLDSTTPEQAIAEYVWNALDAQAKTVTVDLVTMNSERLRRSSFPMMVTEFRWTSLIVSSEFF